jgi:hypothetical protein
MRERVRIRFCCSGILGASRLPSRPGARGQAAPLARGAAALGEHQAAARDRLTGGHPQLEQQQRQGRRRLAFRFPGHGSLSWQGIRFCNGESVCRSVTDRAPGSPRRDARILLRFRRLLAGAAESRCLGDRHGGRGHREAPATIRTQGVCRMAWSAAAASLSWATAVGCKWSQNSAVAQADPEHGSVTL